MELEFDPEDRSRPRSKLPRVFHYPKEVPVAYKDPIATISLSSKKLLASRNHLRHLITLTGCRLHFAPKILDLVFRIFVN